MATQTIQSWAVTGETLTMKVYTFDSDTASDSAAATESTNRKGLYIASFTDLPADTYIVQLETSGGVVRSFFWVTTTSSTATFQAYDQPASTVDTTAIANAVLAAGDIDGYSLEESLKICAAILAGKVSGPEQRISAVDALRAVTINAAYVLRLEKMYGSIEVGKFANFTILAKNPLTVDPLDIKDIQVTGTVVKGVQHSQQR